MRKNNKGVALAYTLMIMLLLFAICALITTITLARVAGTDNYSNRAEAERIYSQIGEIFCSVDGDYIPESGPAEDESAQKSRFKLALEAASFNVNSSSPKWSAELDSYKFLLELSTDKGVNKLIIKNANDTEIYLTVGVKDGHIVEWTKGTTDGQGS